MGGTQKDWEMWHLEYLNNELAPLLSRDLGAPMILSKVQKDTLDVNNMNDLLYSIQN